MKKSVSVILILCMLALMFPLGTLPILAEEDVSPHLTAVPQGYIGIYTTEDLNSIRNDLDANYILMNDINFTEADFEEGGDFYNKGLGWKPIGDDTTVFTGVLQGNYYGIYGLRMCPDNSNTYNSFIAKNSGRILGLTVDIDIQINGSILIYNQNYKYVSAICGFNENIISNCRSLGEIDVHIPTLDAPHNLLTNLYIGGICSNNINSISMCSSAVNVTINTNDSSSLYFITSLTLGGISAAGGESISDCYYEGNIKISSNFCSMSASIGGIAGNITNDLINCYSVCSVDVPKALHFGAIGGNLISTYGQYSNNYFLESISSSDLGNQELHQGKTSAINLKKQSTFTDWNFDTIWKIDEDNGYPKLKNTGIDIPNSSQTGDGTELSPYIITNKNQLFAVRNDLDAHYILGNNIIFDESDFGKDGAFYNYGYGWEPIATDEPFSGVFDGNGYSIKNLQININSEKNGTYLYGLFSKITGTVKNLGIVNTNMNIRNNNFFLGAIAGNNAGGLIENCYSKGTLYSNYYCGGIVGINEGNVIGCYNYSLLRSENVVGGIAAYNKTNNISKCYNMGSLTLYSTTYFTYEGGIAGINSGNINNCFNIGSLTAADYFFNTSTMYEFCTMYIGGIAGTSEPNQGVGSALIDKCYNIGKITSSSMKMYYMDTDESDTVFNIGEIVGNNVEANTAVNCYYLGDAKKGIGIGNGNLTGLTLKEMKQQSSFSTFDFENTWTMDGNENYLFPKLQNMPFNFTGIEGDINNDYVIGATDALLVLQYSVNKIELDETQKTLADLDNNGKVNSSDALLILQISVGKNNANYYNYY